ncbi:hypothetical protein HPB52_024201 [Rhipicephalus sanguineus]|uniref:Uncharacterized protein n=1 Tax=Rhipicephalus sanguineus TaxID=34632 RepID=A0A9D4TCP8_RHISA|nr:hypothetical protein HPB52_024201 [Rhipicephalus sanguineus]
MGIPSTSSASSLEPSAEERKGSITAQPRSTSTEADTWVYDAIAAALAQNGIRTRRQVQAKIDNLTQRLQLHFDSFSYNGPHLPFSTVLMIVLTTCHIDDEAGPPCKRRRLEDLPDEKTLEPSPGPSGYRGEQLIGRGRRHLPCASCTFSRLAGRGRGGL